MKTNFFMAIAILISGTAAAQTNATVKTAQSANANTKAEVNKAGGTTQSNTNISANASTTAQVKTDAVQQTKAHAKKEGKAALATAAEKKDKLQTEAINAAGTVKQEASVRGESNAYVSVEKGATADVATANQVNTEAVQVTEANVREEGKTVVNSAVKAKKDVGAETKTTVTAVKKNVSGHGETGTSVKAAKALKLDASSSQGIKVKPSSIGVKTQAASTSGIKLR